MLLLLPPKLHRHRRKLMKETPVQDLGSMHRRAAELIVVIEVVTRLDTPVIGLWPAADALRNAAAAALRVVAANELKGRMPACSTCRELARIVTRRVWVTREVEKTPATVAALDHLLPVDDQGAPKIAGGRRRRHGLRAGRPPPWCSAT